MISKPPTTEDLLQELAQVTAMRSHADDLLLRLKGACLRSQDRMAELGQADAMKDVTGQSALERAIDETRALIDGIDRVASRLLDELASAEAPTSDAAVLAPVGVLG